MTFEEVFVVGVKPLGVDRRVTRHRFHSTADDKILLVRHDPHRGEGDRLLPGAAKAVQRYARSAVGPSGVQGRHARNVMGMIAGAGPTTEYDIVDIGGVETHALLESNQDLRHVALRVQVGHSALVLLSAPARRTDSIDDPCIRHAALSSSSQGSWGVPIPDDTTPDSAPSLSRSRETSTKEPGVPIARAPGRPPERPRRDVGRSR